MSTKAVLINGSPRINGNTSIMLKTCKDIFASAGIESETLQIGGKNIKGCTACGYCRREQNGKCVIDDEIFNDYFEILKTADIIITGSPVYFGSATPELMAFLDRAGYVGRPLGIFKRKIGGPLTVARRAGQNFTYAQLMYWFMLNDFIVPGSSYWNVGFGREPGDVKEDEEGIKTISNFADNVVWLAQKLID